MNASGLKSGVSSSEEETATGRLTYKFFFKNSYVGGNFSTSSQKKIPISN